ncbi:MAG TPA: hypothetical protein VLG49_05645 [Rhabdochlamydiaceae bacterium]|nr:hypothetical protein [Rhabdochlamydiaceae bacterium]
MSISNHLEKKEHLLIPISNQVKNNDADKETKDQNIIELAKRYYKESLIDDFFVAYQMWNLELKGTLSQDDLIEDSMLSLLFKIPHIVEHFLFTFDPETFKIHQEVEVIKNQFNGSIAAAMEDPNAKQKLVRMDRPILFSKFCILLLQLSKNYLTIEERQKKIDEYFSEILKLVENKPEDQDLFFYKSIFKTIRLILIHIPFDELNIRKNLEILKNHKFFILFNSFRILLNKEISMIEKAQILINKSQLKLSASELKKLKESNIDQDNTFNTEKFKKYVKIEELNNYKSDVTQFRNLIEKELNEKLFDISMCLKNLRTDIKTKFSKPFEKHFTNPLDQNERNNFKAFLAFQEDYEELKQYLNDYQNLILSTSKEILDLADMMTHYFIYFNLEDPEKILSIFKTSEDFSELTEKLKKAIIAFSIKCKENKNILIESISLFRSNTFFHNERNLFLPFANSLLDSVAAINQLISMNKGRIDIVFYYLVHHPLLKSFSEEESIRMKLYEEELQITTEKQTKKKKREGSQKNAVAQTTKKEDESEIPPHSKETSTPVEQKKSVVENPKKILSSFEMAQSNLKNIRSAILQKDRTPSLTAFGAAKAYQNYCSHSHVSISLMERFLRSAQMPMSREMIASFIINIAIFGTLAYEQMITALVSQTQNFKNNEQFFAAVSHDIIELLNACSFSKGKSPTSKEIALARKTNRGEILSRSIPKFVNSYNSKSTEVQQLLIEAYLFAQGDSRINLQTLLKRTVHYFCDIQKTLIEQRRLFPFLSEINDHKELDRVFSSFPGQFLDHLKDITPLKTAPLNKNFAHFDTILDTIPISEKSLYEKEIFKTIRFSISLLKAEFDHCSKENPEDVALSYARVLLLNQQIVEDFGYLLLAFKRIYPVRKEIDHDLLKLAEHLGCKLEDFSKEDQEFLQGGKKTRSLSRFGADSKDTSDLAVAVKAAKSISKDSEKTFEKVEGFEVAKYAKTKKDSSNKEKIHEQMVADTECMHRILEHFLKTS